MPKPKFIPSKFIPSNYSFVVYAEAVRTYKERDGFLVYMEGVDERAFDVSVKHEIDIDLMIETIGREKLMNRILELNGGGVN